MNSIENINDLPKINNETDIDNLIINIINQNNKKKLIILLLKSNKIIEIINRLIFHKIYYKPFIFINENHVC